MTLGVVSISVEKDTKALVLTNSASSPNVEDALHIVGVEGREVEAADGEGDDLVDEEEAVHFGLQSGLTPAGNEQAHSNCAL